MTDAPDPKPSKSHGRLSISASVTPRDLIEEPRVVKNAWKARVITLFPEAFPGTLDLSLTGKALDLGLWALDVIVELFDDASIVVTHRDPLECVASYASMMEAVMVGRSYDRRELGPVVLEYLAAKMDHAMDCRAGMDPARILDVDYSAFVADPAATVASIYDHFGLPAGEALRDAWRAHVADHPQGEHGEHTYSLDDYGLSEDAIRDRFARYLASRG